jgi:hypothetical protein
LFQRMDTAAVAKHHCKSFLGDKLAFSDLPSGS